jgi:asparagine synthase (glutamine-hydrolysing)
MCGLAGFFVLNGDVPEKALLDRMARTLRHRGPDDYGTYSNARIGLVHTRLSIIDLSSHGHQPMSSADESVTLVFNGEIYNHVELRQELTSKYGCSFKSSSDTEVILQGYLTWGDEILSKLNGMFALAIYDKSKGRVILARDRFGVKPLYVFEQNNIVVFASEIKAILDYEEFYKELNLQSLGEYLYFTSSLGDQTFFSGVKSISPGECVLITDQGTSKHSFVDIFPRKEIKPKLNDAAKEVRRLLESAVERQLVSDVPVGVFLSGGVDSAAIATIASRISRQRIRTYTADFTFTKDKGEVEQASKIAEKIGSDHKIIDIGPFDLVDTLEALVDAHDEPFSDAANIPIYLMSQKLQGSPKVILQGDGGDELFAGYARYSRIQYSKYSWLLGKVLMPFANMIPSGSKLNRSLKALHALHYAEEELKAANIMSQEPYGEDPTMWLGRKFRDGVRKTDPFSRYRQIFQKFADKDPVQRMLYTDLSIILPDIYFSKVDRACMANGIEIRVPMMDNDLVAYALSLQSSLKVRYGIKKRVLKIALKGVLDESILHGPKKGFNVPISDWLRDPLADYLRKTLSDGFLDKMLVFAVWYKKHFEKID